MSFDRLSQSPVRLTSVATTVVWLVFVAGGVAGLRLQYQQAQARTIEQPPIVAEKMDVRLIGTQVEPAVASASAQPLNSNPAPPAMPGISPVLAPPSEIPFAIPVNAPLRQAQIPASSPVQHLVFGTGEGDKPPPEYPREAKLAHQQGTVVVRFTTDQYGHVTDAEAASPSPYPLLNEAAVRAVRETWDHFPTGKSHVYDISFQFELHQQ